MGRKRSLGKKYSTLDKTVCDYLKERGVYDVTDFVLVDELIFNSYVADNAKEAIITDGIMVNVRKDPDADPLMQTNQAVSIYNLAVKNIQALCTKLGITVQERTKLKLETEEVDPLEKLLAEGSE